MDTPPEERESPLVSPEAADVPAETAGIGAASRPAGDTPQSQAGLNEPVTGEAAAATIAPTKEALQEAGEPQAATASAASEKSDSPSKDQKEGEPRRRKPHFLVTWAIILAVAGFVDFCSTITSRGGAAELRAFDARVMSYLHNLQPFRAADDFMARLTDSEYGWNILNWDAPFNITVARTRIGQQFDRQIAQAKSAAASDPSLPDVENRLQQAWAQQPPLGSQVFDRDEAAFMNSPQDFDDAVDDVLQAHVNALPAYQEAQILRLGPGFSTLASRNIALYSTRRSFYESQLSTDADFTRILATFQGAITQAGAQYESSMGRLNRFRLPAFLRGGEDTAPLTTPQDSNPNIIIMAVVKAPGLLDAYMNTIRLAIASNRVQTVIAVAALVLGALLLYFMGANNCFTVVLKLFFVPLAGSVVIGLIWGIAYVIALVFRNVLAAPAIDVLGSTIAAPAFHWGAGRIMEHHLTEKGLEKYAKLTEKAIAEEESKIAGG